MEDIQPVIQELPSIKTALTLAFYLLFGLFAVFTGVIYYHWTAYTANKTVTGITLVTYMALTLPLLLIMGGIILTM